MRPIPLTYMYVVHYMYNGSSYLLLHEFTSRLTCGLPRSWPFYTADLASAICNLQLYILPQWLTTKVC